MTNRTISMQTFSTTRSRRASSLALGWALVLTLASVPGGSAAASPGSRSSGPPSSSGPCDLLLDEEVLAMQQRAVVARVPSRRQSVSFHLLQCFYRTADFARSVSLALSVPSADAADGPRRYWGDRFHPEDGFPDGKRQPPQPVEGLGDEAFWVGDPVAGSLYVLTGERFLRLSVGGVADEALRRERATRLAEWALDRMALEQ